MDVKFKVKGFQANIKGVAKVEVEELEISYENFNLKEIPAIIKETRKVLREIADIEREASTPLNPFGNFPTFVPGGAPVDGDEDLDEDEDIEDELDEDEDEDDDEEEDSDDEHGTIVTHLTKEKPKKTPGRRSGKKSSDKKRQRTNDDTIGDIESNDETLDHE